MADNINILDANGNFITVVATNTAGVFTPWHYNVQQIANAVVSNSNPVPVSFLNSGLTNATPVPTTIMNAGYVSSVSVTRPADTSAYTANDVIGTSNTTASSAVLSFASIGANNADILITSVQLEVDSAALIASEAGYYLYLFNATPPSALADNNAWGLPSGDRATFLGSISLGTPTVLGSTLYVETNGLNKQIRMPNGNTIFGYLSTVAGYTPTSARVYKVTLHSRLVI